MNGSTKCGAKTTEVLEFKRMTVSEPLTEYHMEECCLARQLAVNVY